MLILPLHRKWNRSNFPLVTMLLVVANVFVYFFLQSGDDRIEKQAISYYEQSDLRSVEFPAYIHWLNEHGHGGEAHEGDPPGRLFMELESDTAFLADLHSDKVILPSDPGYADWQRNRAEFDRIFESSFIRKHEMRFSHFEPDRILTMMFMHASFDHIFGNMLFLLVIGMLVEGALGPGWFLGLYLLGGLGATLTSLAWHWGTEGGALGASGAISALMGAYCVFWGRRKVKVFYWFFVVFDYVKAPALLMLVVWFGWGVIYPWLAKENIDFAAHGGGMLAGIALAFALRHGGLVRNDFIEEEERVERHQLDDAAFEQAQQLLGQLEIPKAREILMRIDKAEPGQLRVMVALYRCARFAGRTNELDAAIARVLGFATTADADIRQIQSAYLDYSKACGGAPRLASELLLGLLPSWARHGDDAAAESLLRDVSAIRPAEQGLPAAWFALALRAPEGSNKRRQLLAYLLEHYAQSEFAPKAQFLLSQD